MGLIYEFEILDKNGVPVLMAKTLFLQILLKPEKYRCISVNSTIIFISVMHLSKGNSFVISTHFTQQLILY